MSAGQRNGSTAGVYTEPEPGSQHPHWVLTAAWIQLQGILKTPLGLCGHCHSRTKS